METFIFWFGFFMFVLIAKRIYDTLHLKNNRDPYGVLTPIKKDSGSINFKQIFFISFLVTALFNVIAFTGLVGMAAWLVLTTFPAMIVSGFLWLALLVKDKLSSK